MARTKKIPALPRPLVTMIMEYEEGQIDGDDLLLLFSYLIKTGLINQLQGSYGRTAVYLMKHDLINKYGTILKSFEEVEIG